MKFPLSQNLHFRPQNTRPKFSPISIIASLTYPSSPPPLTNGGRSHRSEVALDPRPSPLPPWRPDSSLQDRERGGRRGSTFRDRRDRRLVDEGRFWSRQNPSCPSCAPIVTQSKSTLGMARSATDEELVWSLLPRLIKGSRGVRRGREESSSSSSACSSTWTRRKFTRSISITIGGTEHYRF